MQTSTTKIAMEKFPVKPLSPDLDMAELDREAFHRPWGIPTLRQFLIMTLDYGMPGEVVFWLDNDRGTESTAVIQEYGDPVDLSPGKSLQEAGERFARCEAAAMDRAVVDRVFMPLAQVHASEGSEKVEILPRRLDLIRKTDLGPGPCVLACCRRTAVRLRFSNGFSPAMPRHRYAGEFGVMSGFRLVEIPWLYEEAYAFSEAVGFEVLVKSSEVVRDESGALAWSETAAMGPVDEEAEVIAFMAWHRFKEMGGEG